MTDTEGIPDYADDDTTAYDEADRPRLDDSRAALPADEPLAVDGHGTTAAEQLHGESLAARLVREVPDVAVAEPDENGDHEDDEPARLGPLSLDEPGPDAPVGRLVAPDEGAGGDAEAGPIARDTHERGELTAEEAAMHIVTPDETR
jgi:hypothetical protein